MCVSTCPGSVIGKDRVLNELPFIPSTERCPQPIKKSSLIKGSAILINVIKLDLVFLHKTLLSSYLMCIRDSLKGNMCRKMTCNAPYGICRVFMSQVLFQCPPVNPLDWFIVFFTALTDVQQMYQRPEWVSLFLVMHQHFCAVSLWLLINTYAKHNFAMEKFHAKLKCNHAEDA